MVFIVKNKIFLNSVTSVCSQIMLMVIAIIVPRIMIKGYGSDVYGFFGTVVQIFSYIALLESGITAVTQINLYKPIVQNDRKEISYILSLSNSYYHRITIYYIFVVIVIAIFFPFLIKTNISYEFIFFIILLEGGGSSINFWFIEKWRALLSADGRIYFESVITFIVKMITYIVKIEMAVNEYNICMISACGFFISVINIFVYYWYIKRTYPWIKLRKYKGKLSKLKGRNSFVISDVAWTIFSSTDMILISIMLSSSLASVYSVYCLVYTSIVTLINVLYSSVSYLLGQIYQGNRESYVKLHDSYESFFIILTSVAMSCCSILVIPFISLYTEDIKDTDYIYLFMPPLMGVVQVLSWDRYVSGNLICIAGYANKSMLYSIIEAFLNIFLSIIFCFIFGVYGIIVATIMALTFKVVMLTRLANNIVLRRSCKPTIRRIVSNLLVYILISYYFYNNYPKVSDYFSIALCGGVTFVWVLFLHFVVAIITDYNTLKFSIKFLFKREIV